MTPKDNAEFANIMALLSEVYDDGKPLTVIKMKIFHEALVGFEIESIKTAVKRMIATRVYPSFPKPAEIIEEINGGKGDQALIAWAEVIETVRRVGPYASVKFADETIHAVIDFLGGWPKTAEWEDDQLKWIQKEFERLYAVMKTGKKKTYLPGIHEISNAGEAPPPVMIGFDRRLLEQ